MTRSRLKQAVHQGQVNSTSLNPHFLLEKKTRQFILTSPVCLFTASDLESVSSQHNQGEQTSSSFSPSLFVCMVCVSLVFVLGL